MAVIGIDLGTTYSAASIFRNGQTEIIDLEGSPILPSVVSVLQSGTIAVGNTAKRNQAKNPQDTIVEVKRLMGKSDVVSLGDKKFSPQEISAMILKKIKELAEEQLGEPINGVVISCPAYFKDPQRAATKEAGEIAKMKVLRIVNEPTAAAYAYGLGEGQGSEKRLALVYDLGGGTFDVTVIEIVGGNLEVIGTGGDPNLGGGNFDDKIVDWILGIVKTKNPGYAATLTEDRERVLRMRLKSFAEDSKKKLCSDPPATEVKIQIAQIDTFEGKPVPFNDVLTMENFEAMINDLLENSMKWLDEAMKVPNEKHGYTEEDITDVLLVGGSTRVPKVRRLLKDRYGESKLRGVESGINPDEIVARGAGMVAASVSPDSTEEIKSTTIDVTGHTLSVETLEDETSKKLVLHPLIDKDSAIPCGAAHVFSSMGNFQTQIKVKVYQGEGTDPKSPEVTMIGEFIMDIDPIRDSIPLEIGLEINDNGILVAHATNMTTGREVRTTINRGVELSTMTQAQVLERAANLEKLSKEKIGRKVNPLDGGAQPGPQPQSQSGWSRPAPQTQPSVATPAPVPQTNAASAVDPASAMNPIVRTLYQKAISNFNAIPVDRQMDVMMVVSSMEQAAGSGDQKLLFSLYQQLSKLMQGVA